MGARQLVLTSRLDGPAGCTGFGLRGQIVRTGVDTRLARQAWAPLAAPLALSGTPVDVVHGHCGEDIAVLPLAWLAARRHRCPLVITVHASVRTICGSPRRARRGRGWQAARPNAGRWPPRTW